MGVATPAVGVTVAETVLERVLTEHRDVVEATLACAGRAATDLPDPADRDAVVEALERELRDVDIHEAYVGLLRDVVQAAGFALPSEPVPSPPYVVVTGRGVLLRATVEAGRIVILLRGFRLDREAGGYVSVADRPESRPAPREVVEVRFRETEA